MSVAYAYFFDEGGALNTRIGGHWHPLIKQACEISGMTAREIGLEAITREPDLGHAEAIRFYIAEILAYYGAEATLRQLGRKAEPVAAILGEVSA